MSKNSDNNFQLTIMDQKMIGPILHIEREVHSDQMSISLSEWKTTIASIPGLRLQTEETVFSIPRRESREIRIPFQDGTIEVYLSDYDFWSPSIRWVNGRGRFRARAKMDEMDPVWKASIQLAKQLGASIRDERGGTYYDGVSGQLILHPAY
jgi:hypothetical protein